MASATIVNNGNGTFTDTATGEKWMDVSTFYGDDYSQDQSLLLPGYAFATQAQMDQLETDTGLTAATPDATFISVAAAMGVPTPTPLDREIIWGVYGDGSTWTFTYGPESGGIGWDGGGVGVPSYADLGAFAVAVPEPATWSLMLLGAFGLGAALRTRRHARTA